MLLYDRLKQFYVRYERLLVPGLLLVGVAVDVITFRSINISTAFILLGVYAIIAGGAVAFLNAYEEDPAKPRGSALRYLRLVMPLVLQFTFGALLSASLIFYWFSGAFSVSWPLMLVVAFLMISNETLRHLYLRPTVQLGVYFFTLFSFFSLLLPFLFNSIAVWVFLLAGVASLALVSFFLQTLSALLPSIKRQERHIAFILLGVFLVMNALYFSNIIPPIPLSLREADVYHNVQRAGGTYRVLGETEPFPARLLPGETVHLGPGEKVFIYSAIFAPSELNTTIVHRWSWYDEELREWKEKDRLSFRVFGGRNEGYRGYSVKSRVEPGRWRVQVETERGQALGRVRFTVEPVPEPPLLVELTK